MECEYCAYNAYDEEMDEYYCSVNLDEDDIAKKCYHDIYTCTVKTREGGFIWEKK